VGTSWSLSVNWSKQLDMMLDGDNTHENKNVITTDGGPNILTMRWRVDVGLRYKNTFCNTVLELLKTILHKLQMICTQNRALNGSDPPCSSTSTSTTAHTVAKYCPCLCLTNLVNNMYHKSMTTFTNTKACQMLLNKGKKNDVWP
jgi:hypothetical protein